MGMAEGGVRRRSRTMSGEQLVSGLGAGDDRRVGGPLVPIRRQLKTLKNQVETVRLAVIKTACGECLCPKLPGGSWCWHKQLMMRPKPTECTPVLVAEPTPAPPPPEEKEETVDDTQWHLLSGTRILRCLRPNAPKLVGIEGKWYDVSSFAKHHPGGSVILEFCGRDATLQFRAFHDPKILKRFRAVGEYDYKATVAGADPAERDFLALLGRLEADGFFGPELGYYAQKVAFCAMLAVGVVCGVAAGWWKLPAMALGLFWIQSAFHAHDLMHNQIFKDRKRDQSHGWFWGNVALGASSIWWRDEHFEHHVFTNSYDERNGCTDPQQHEVGLWAQDPVLRPFTNEILASIQHYTFLPLLIVGGRLALVGTSLANMKGAGEIWGCALHFAWVAVLLSAVAHQHSWQVAGLFYLGASVVQGILGIQLCISHYDKPFETKERVATEAGWLRRQVASCKDVECPWWHDWFHGGLNLHRAHHLMPRLSRARFRAVDPMLNALFQEHQIETDTEPFFSAVASTLTHLRTQALRQSVADIMIGS